MLCYIIIYRMSKIIEVPKVNFSVAALQLIESKCDAKLKEYDEEDLTAIGKN